MQQQYKQTSSTEGNDRSREPACHKNILNTSQVSIFSDCKGQLTAAHSWIWPNSELMQDFSVVLHTCKNEEDPIKIIGARVFTALYIVFSDVQRQVTL